MDFRVGWEEWVALPGLRVPAIRAKIDTGAQSSALHAFAIHPFRRKRADWVRFGLHPLPERPDIELICEAPLVGQRDITSSNGESELRFVIRTDIAVGGRTWQSEISLTNRESMAYRMLLGRRALEEGVLVDVTTSLVHGTPDLAVYYDGLPHVRRASASLALSCLIDGSDSEDATRLKGAASARGHRMTIIDTGRLQVQVGPDVVSGPPDPGRPDKVLAWASPDIVLRAALRRLEFLGARSLNSSAALAIIADPLHLFQRLAERGIAIPRTIGIAMPEDIKAVARSLGGTAARVRNIGELGTPTVDAGSRSALVALLEYIRARPSPLMLQRDVRAGAKLTVLTVGGQVVAALRERDGIEVAAKLSPELRRLAIRAARALGLKVAALDFVEGADGPICIDARSYFPIVAAEDATGRDIAAAIMDCLESAGRSDRRR